LDIIAAWWMLKTSKDDPKVEICLAGIFSGTSFNEAIFMENSGSEHRLFARLNQGVEMDLSKNGE
jgi:hypothetical protein